MNFKIVDLFKNYFKNYILATIVLIFTLCLGLFIVFNNYEEKYVAKTTIMLGVCEHNCDEDSHLNINFNKAVVQDYMQLIKSKTLLKKANDKLKLTYTSDKLESIINTYFEEDTEYITIEVTSNNKKYSANLAYSIYEVLIEEVDRIFDINNIHLVDTDEQGSLKYSINIYILITIFISIIISFIVTVIKYLFFPDFYFIKTIRAVFNKKNKKITKINNKNKIKNIKKTANIKRKK